MTSSLPSHCAKQAYARCSGRYSSTPIKTCQAVAVSADQVMSGLAYRTTDVLGVVCSRAEKELKSKARDKQKQKS